MKKSLKFLGLTILPLATLTSSLVVSGACDKKNKPEPKPQQDENNKDKNNEKLEKALEELEKIAKKLEFKIKTSDYFIKDALDIKKYTYTLKSGYEFILKSIEKTNQDEVTIKYSVKDSINKLESKTYEQKFNGFKKQAPITDVFDVNKHSEQLIDLFNLDKNEYASQNKDLFNANDKKDINFELQEVKLLSYNDLDGTAQISVKGIFNKKTFSVDSLTINNRFKKPPLIDEIHQVNPKLNTQKMIEDGKSIEDLKTYPIDQLLTFFETLTIYDKQNNKINLVNFVKDNPEYKITNLKLVKDGQKNAILLKVQLQLKTFSNNKETDIKKDIIDTPKLPLEGDSYNEKDILNYILKNKISFLKTIENDPNKKESFASENKYWFEKQGIDISGGYAIFDKQIEEKFKKQFGIKEFLFKTNSAGYNDVTGELFANIQFGMFKNDEFYYSDPINITIKGFKKLDYDFFNELFEIKQKNENDSKWQTVKEEIKKLYLNSNKKPNFEITEPTLIKKLFKVGNEIWHVLRPGNSNKDEFKLQSNNNWTLTYNNKSINYISDFVEKAYDKKQSLVHSQYWLNGINIKFVKINNFKEQNGKISCDFVFEISFIINNNSSSITTEEKTIKVNKTFTMEI
ncbi:hypothetical protein ACJA27_02560 [Mycoplasmopsis lipophila]|uniref:hypothetical protein n=1 Tax=Mycoplasmopsis lipophila TaxID=2117 RepID=UPI00387389A2